MHRFEVFRKDVAASRARPYVTIQRRGAISLNAAAHRALGHPEAVELLFNAVERIVGLRPVDPHRQHSYLLRCPTRSPAGPFLLSAVSFTRYYGIDTTTALRREGYLDGGMLCVALDAEPERQSG